MKRRSVLAGASALTLSAAFGGPALAQSRLRLAHFSPTTDPNHVTSEEFASRIADETGGAFNVQIFPASQLGGEVDAVEGGFWASSTGRRPARRCWPTGCRS